MLLRCAREPGGTWIGSGLGPDLAVDLEEFSSSARFGLQDHISRRMSTLIHYRRMTRVFKVNGCCPSFRQIEVRPACCSIKPVGAAYLVFTTVSRGIVVDRTENLPRSGQRCSEHVNPQRRRGYSGAFRAGSSPAPSDHSVRNHSGRTAPQPA